MDTREINIISSNSENAINAGINMDAEYSKVKISKFSCLNTFINSPTRLQFYFGVSGAETLRIFKDYGNFDTTAEILSELQFIDGNFGYDSIAHKFFYNNTTGSTYVVRNVSLYRLLGFNSTTEILTLPATTKTYFPNYPDLISFRLIFVETSLPRNNVITNVLTNKENNFSNILGVIPILTAFDNTITYYDESDDYYVICPSYAINSFSVNIKNEYGEIITFTQPYSLEIKVTTI